MPGGSPFGKAWSDAEARRRTWLALALSLAAAVAAILCFRMFHHRWWAALAGDKPGPEDFARWGTYWATGLNALALGVAAVVAVVRAHRRVREVQRGGASEVAPTAPAPLAATPVARREWIWLLLVLVLAAGLRWPRMGLSFYNDEAHTFRNYIAGRFKLSDDGTPKWRQAKWSETLWLNKVGNNLAPCSVFGRLSFDAWRRWSGAEAGAVSETAVRLPQFLAGMASLTVLWLAARGLGGPRLALGVALLAALHPWHVRYCTEARAYGFLLLGVAWSFHALHRAWEDDRWRRWLSFGCAQFLCVWSFPGAVYFVAVVDLLAAGLLVRRALRGGSGWRPVGRFGVGVACGGMLALQWMLPTAPQLAEAMRQLESVKGVMGREWWADALAGMFYGVRGWDWDPENSFNPALLRVTSRWPGSWALVLLMGGFWVAGCVRLARRHALGALVALAGPIAVLLSWALMSSQGRFLHPWYVLFAVPGVVVALAAGVAGWSQRGAVGRVALGLAGLAMAGPWLAADFVYGSRGKENLRGVAVAAREGSAPGTIFAAMLADVDVYDGRVILLKSAADFEAVVQRARREGVALRVSVGHLGIGETAAVVARLRDSGLFEPGGVFRGFEEEQFTHYLFRLR